MTYLVNGAENVSIVLLETTNTSKTRQSSRELIAVQNTEIGHTPRQVSVVYVLVGKDLAVARAVHGLEAKLFLLNLKQEHAVGVVIPVARRLPQIRLVHVGGHDFLKATLLVLGLLKVQKGVVNASTVRHEESTSGRNFIEEEEFLVLSNLAMVSFGGLGKESLMLFQSLLVGE